MQLCNPESSPGGAHRREEGSVALTEMHRTSARPWCLQAHGGQLNRRWCHGAASTRKMRSFVRHVSQSGACNITAVAALNRGVRFCAENCQLEVARGIGLDRSRVFEFKVAIRASLQMFVGSASSQAFLLPIHMRCEYCQALTPCLGMLLTLGPTTRKAGPQLFSLDRAVFLQPPWRHFSSE